MKIKYCILSFFICITIFSQDKIELKEQCKSQYDSIFKKSFGERFFKKNIKYYKNKSSINVLTNDPNNEQYDNIFLNIENHSEIKKYMDKYPNFDSLEYYQYGFLYKGKPFHESTYTCETINKKEYSDYDYKFIMNYYNKIKSKEYLSPKNALKVAKANGLKNICYQSLTNASFHNKKRDVWYIQDCSDSKKIKVIELDPKNGSVLSRYDKSYGNGAKATYWGLFNKNK